MVTVSLPASAVAVLLSVAGDAVRVSRSATGCDGYSQCRRHHKACQFLHRVLLDFFLEMLCYNTVQFFPDFSK